MDRYAVIGNPVDHSLSPIIHQQFAAQTKQVMGYEKLYSPIHQFENVVNDFFANGGKGLNVTAPFKERAYSFVDELSDRAKQAKAVNTIKLQGDSLFGDNTDGVGLLKDLQENLLFKFQDKSILILGAGGAVRGVLSNVIEAKPGQITIANRTLEKAEKLVERHSFDHIKVLAFDEIAGEFDLIINGISAGMAQILPLISSTIVTPDTVCYDMSYAEQPTSFMIWCAGNGATNVHDGKGMLVAQAAASFFLWKGVVPDAGKVVI